VLALKSIGELRRRRRLPCDRPASVCGAVRRYDRHQHGRRQVPLGYAGRVRRVRDEPA
jgi:hypothetical protein